MGGVIYNCVKILGVNWECLGNWDVWVIFFGSEDEKGFGVWGIISFVSCFF